MKKILLIIILLFTLTVTPSVAFAQGMMGGNNTITQNDDDHTAREEQEGKEIWDNLQTKQLECKDLTDDNYAVLGEYFMGQSIGNTQRHAAMNQMMTGMMGENGEEQMHITMGKKNSGCDTGTEGGGSNSMMGYGWNNMMGNWGVFGLLTWILIITFLVLGILYFWKEINRKVK